mmetsp:Transcript_85485/g.169638  ORF Transcript_85485/g.169638 Transcript_85485/m.169638 type:complete len:425 (+) Transcript_85485:66-1340(+)|eukprot:CAMPEP_0172724764 /NCGR_PEP_ID=MMETSP1074-20121228/86806_1 /TAXON_ID=2916 /ORGANISM="Ceratium fusus, Strain PA161109" /LENGTH=424 /DNA_ID=CAMNT_0013551331 /DNA_START=53 /DNA_END=1327 /DNA_ORIENTATION=+
MAGRMQTAGGLISPRRVGRPLKSPFVRHGDSFPEPDPQGLGQSGPGQWRIFAADAKFVPGDELNYGQGGSVAQSPFAMGPKANVREGSEIRTLDISRYNEQHHNWKRIDTFQTPTGHIGDRALIPDIENTPSVCGFRAEMLDGLRKNIREDLRADLLDVVAQLKEVRRSVSQVAEELNSLRAEVRLPELVDEIRKVKSEVDFTPVLDQLGKSDQRATDLLGEIRRVKTEIDFFPVLDEVRRMKDAVKAKPVDLSRVTDSVKQLKTELVAEMRKTKNDGVIEAIRKFKTDVEPRSVKAEVDLTLVIQAIQKLKEDLPFSKVLEEIGKSKTDLQPVLSRAARILEELRKGRLEVLNELNRGVRPMTASTPRPREGDRLRGSMSDKRDFQLDITEEGTRQTMDFSLSSNEVLQIPIAPLPPPSSGHS